MVKKQEFLTLQTPFLEGSGKRNDGVFLQPTKELGEGKKGKVV